MNMLTTLRPIFPLRLGILNHAYRRNMKKGILLLLLAGTFQAKAQKLKDLLYSGKLKMDTTSVIRNTDDLSTKIDTSERKPAEPQKTVIATLPADSVKNVASQAPPPAAATQGSTDTAMVAAPTSTETETAPAPTQAAAPVKSNNKIWKEYTDSLVNTLKTEVLSSRKVKKETYYIMVDYEIGTDSQVSITNVTASPENTFLQDQVKERILSSPPQLAPVLDNTNKPRKVKRKYNFTITKE